MGLSENRRPKSHGSKPQPSNQKDRKVGSFDKNEGNTIYKILEYVYIYIYITDTIAMKVAILGYSPFSHVSIIHLSDFAGTNVPGQT